MFIIYNIKIENGTIVVSLYLKLGLQHAKYLLDFISLITKNVYTLKDSFEFVSMIDRQDPNSFMCSFETDSLFTNVPWEETIDIVIKDVFGKKRENNGLSKNDFRDLLKLTTMGTVSVLMVIITNS